MPEWSDWIKNSTELVEVKIILLSCPRILFAKTPCLCIICFMNEIGIIGCHFEGLLGSFGLAPLDLARDRQDRLNALLLRR